HDPEGLGQDNAPHPLGGGHSEGDPRFVLPPANGEVGAPDHLRTVGAVVEGEGQNPDEIRGKMDSRQHRQGEIQPVQLDEQRSPAEKLHHGTGRPTQGAPPGQAGEAGQKGKNEGQNGGIAQHLQSDDHPLNEGRQYLKPNVDGYHNLSAKTVEGPKGPASQPRQSSSAVFSPGKFSSEKLNR